MIPETIRRRCIQPIAWLNRDDGTIQSPWPTDYMALGIHRSVLKDGRLGSIVEVARIQDPRIKFDYAGLAELYGMEISRLFVDHCLPASG